MRGGNPITPRQYRLYIPVSDARHVHAAKREAHNQNFSGRLVDENMIVLRKRIHEMKMIEKNYEPPMEWMDWEKQFYTSYDSMICEAMGHLQSYLMETRPCLALGMIALIGLSVPTSTAVVMYNLLELTKGVLSGAGGKWGLAPMQDED
ncbi:hypothetical protein DH2020_011860 [Rehmannia glutinosa]|uniref:Uncharacterized protein n=1 Tax=Rehmannia glutinosa TaxID=99300 RepID=A0ABR0XEM2_REHGL